MEAGGAADIPQRTGQSPHKESSGVMLRSRPAVNYKAKGRYKESSPLPQPDTHAEGWEGGQVGTKEQSWHMNTNTHARAHQNLQ